jgi:cytochrome P450 family 628
MLEVRRVVGELFSRYDIALTLGHTREEFLGGKQDTFTVVSAPLPLVFTPRPFEERP